MKNTIAIIGAGRVGSTVAYSLIMKNLVAELIMIDVNHERCEGEVRDLADTLAFCETANIRAAKIEDARTANIIIICAGHAQQPGQTRIELIEKNKAVITSIMNDLGQLSPETIVLVVTNPVDIMTSLAQKASSHSQTHIFGTGTWLDTQRLRRYLGKELDIAPESIDAYIIGEHGDSQCAAWSQTHVGGTSIQAMGISEEQCAQIEEATKQEAYKIIEKKCGTYYGIAACVADICETIIFDQKRIMPVSSYAPDLDVCLSIPVIVGKNGIERNTLPNLNAQETESLKESARKLKEILDSL